MFQVCTSVAKSFVLIYGFSQAVKANTGLQFLGVFAKSRKATISFMSACMEHLGSHWTDFDET